MPRTLAPRSPLDPDAARYLVSAAQARAAILVEGWSDQAALEALARRRGRDLLTEGIVVVPIGGASNMQRFVQALGPHGLGVFMPTRAHSHERTDGARPERAA